MISNNETDLVENENSLKTNTNTSNEITESNRKLESKDEVHQQIDHSYITDQQQVDSNNNVIENNNKAIIVPENSLIPIIPSAYSLRVIQNIYPQPINSINPYLIDYESNIQQQSAQWHNEQLPQPAAYIAPGQSFIANTSQTQPQISPIYPIDSATDQIYEQYTHYPPNFAYSYPMQIPHQWNSYPYQDGSNQINSANHTASSSTKSSNKTHFAGYDFSTNKEKRQPNGATLNSTNQYHYVSNDYSNANNLAQHSTDNANNGLLPFYQNTSLSQFKGKDANKFKNNKTNDFKHKNLNKKYQQQNLNDETQSYKQQNGGKKRYSEIANHSINNNNITKTNETSSSVSPITSSNLDNGYQRESNNLIEYNNYSSFYNMPYNHLPYYNQYSKDFNYNKQAHYYTTAYDPVSLEHEMANLNLISGFYPYAYTEPNQQHDNMVKNDPYDPKEFFINGEREGYKNSKFFVIKSYSKNDVIHCIDYGIWCSTPEGNKKLDKAFMECSNENYASVYLFFSINGSGQFCGMAQMTSRVDYNSRFEIWSQDKWQGKFYLEWIYIKDVPNSKLRHIILANNENKPVTNSRDTQEVFYDDAIRVVDVIRQHVKKSSILDEKSSKFFFNTTTTNTNEVNRFNNLDKKKYFN